MKAILKRYRFTLATAAVLGLCLLVRPGTGLEALRMVGSSLRGMLLVIPPVFILLGLLDVWVPRETMIRHLGEGSGLRGGALAVLLGSAAAGPLYAAFPVAAVFIRKGAGLRNVAIFIGAWSTTKIPMFLLEVSTLGWRFSLARLLAGLPGIILIGLALERLIGPAEWERIRHRVAGM